MGCPKWHNVVYKGQKFGGVAMSRRRRREKKIPLVVISNGEVVLPFGGVAILGALSRPLRFEVDTDDRIIVDEVSAHRDTHCPCYYGICLPTAWERRLASFSCSLCPHFVKDRQVIIPHSRRGEEPTLEWFGEDAGHGARHLDEGVSHPIVDASPLRENSLAPMVQVESRGVGESVVRIRRGDIEQGIPGIPHDTASFYFSIIEVLADGAGVDDFLDEIQRRLEDSASLPSMLRVVAKMFLPKITEFLAGKQISAKT